VLQFLTIARHAKVGGQPRLNAEFDSTDAAWKIRAAAFRATIIYFRNHPFIMVWEGGNQ